jgi:hypothetical protein
MNPERYCAYNQTSQRLVATNVEAADGSGGGAEARLLSLGPEGGTTLWISPFRGISPACARFPLDLVFLNDDRVVLDTVEFFPMNVGGQASSQATSVLVLAADTLAHLQIRSGDRLAFSASDQMMQYLQDADSHKQVTAQPAHRDEVAIPAPLEFAREMPAPEEPQPVVSDRRASEPAHAQLEFSKWAEPEVLPGPGNKGAPGRGVPETPALGSQATAGDGALSPAVQLPSELPKRPKPAAGPRRRVPKQAAAEARVEEPPAIAPGYTNVSPSTPVPAEPPVRPEPAIVPREPQALATAPIAAGLPAEKNPAEKEAIPARTSERQPWKKQEAPSSWLRRLLWRETPDPRSSPRESLPDLVAYFFTGGTPAPHSVRDISTSGLYLVTRERWYKGTVVQMTLSDRRQSTLDRSIAVYAKAVRLGSDGVGFQFILEGEPRHPSKAIETYAPTNGIDAARIGSFVEHYRATMQQMQ